MTDDKECVKTYELLKGVLAGKGIELTPSGYDYNASKGNHWVSISIEPEHVRGSYTSKTGKYVIRVHAIYSDMTNLFRAQGYSFYPTDMGKIKDALSKAVARIIVAFEHLEAAEENKAIKGKQEKERYEAREKALLEFKELVEGLGYPTPQLKGLIGIDHACETTGGATTLTLNPNNEVEIKIAAGDISRLSEAFRRNEILPALFKLIDENGKKL